MSAVVKENDCRDGAKDERSRRGRKVAANANEHQNWDKKFRRSVLNNFTQGNGDQSGTIGHADAKEHNQHNAKGRIADNVADEIIEHVGNTISAQEIVNADGRNTDRAGRLVIHLARCAPAAQ